MSKDLLKRQAAARKAIATRRRRQAEKERVMDMYVYKAKSGMGPNVIDDWWLVRAPNFLKAGQKAEKRLAQYEYTAPRQIVSLELIGREEN